jgi:hypothetical protein
MGACYRRARLSALAGGGAFGSAGGLGAVALAIASLSPVSMTASSNFAIAVRIKPAAGRGEIYRPRWCDGWPPSLRRPRVREVNCRHGPDIIGRHLSSKERVDTPRGGRAFSNAVASTNPAEAEIGPDRRCGRAWREGVNSSARNRGWCAS